MIMKDIGVGRCKSGESTKFDTMTKTKIIYGINTNIHTSLVAVLNIFIVLKTHTYNGGYLQHYK